jgi:hypothetical protein
MHEIIKIPYMVLKELDGITDPDVIKTNGLMVNTMMQKLTPLVELILTIYKFCDIEFFDILRFFHRMHPYLMRRGFMSLNKKMIANGIQFEPETWRALIHEDVWMPFGEETDDKGQLILNANFDNAVMNATHAATVIIAAIMQKQMQEEGAVDVSIDVPAIPFNPNLVKLLDDTTQCLYFYDGTQYVKTHVGHLYDFSILVCLTPLGLVRDLTPDVDFRIDGQRILTLNPSNIKQFSFRLTSESRDDPRVTLAFSHYVHTIPFNVQGVTESLHVYVRANQRDVVIPISYHSEYVDVTLPPVAAWQLAEILIDPNRMIEQFALDMRNVHLHSNLQIPDCPMEQLVSARVNFERLTEPICSFLDYLVASTASLDDSVNAKTHSKIPYIYSINMQTMTCTRTQIIKHDLEHAIPLLTLDEFAHFNAITTTADGLNLEQHLIRYTMFQMMMSYRKFTLDDFRTCPDHHILFDLYLRRGAGEVGYHYDLTPGNIVSSVGLLYSMPRGHVKMGPQLIPRRYRTDKTISNINVIPMSAFVMRNSAIMFNNATYSHTTPNVINFISRIPYHADYEVKNDQHKSIFTAKLHVTHDPIAIPESIRKKLRESSANPSRTFLRSWHIVKISQTQMENLGTPEPVVFSNGMAFHEMAQTTLLECFEWLRTTGCMCIEVEKDALTGEIVPPSRLAGHLRGGRIMMSAAPNPQQLKVLSPQQLKTQQSQQLKPLNPLKPQSKTQYSSSSHRSKMASPIRASTLSISHLKQQFGSKVKKIRAVLKNPKKNLVVMSGPMITITQRRARSHSHTQYAPKKRSHTRKVRSAI